MKINWSSIGKRLLKWVKREVEEEAQKEIERRVSDAANPPSSSPPRSL